MWVWLGGGEGDVVSGALEGQGQTLGARSGNGWMEKRKGNTGRGIEGRPYGGARQEGVMEAGRRERNPWACALVLGENAGRWRFGWTL